MTDAVVVLVTAPSETVAEEIARALVGERLIACANLLPGARSIYRWEGVVQEGREILMVMKTTTGMVPALKLRLPELHPYACPELVVLPVADGLPAYLRWIAENVGP